ncbi:hypothetical protein SAMN04244548_05360 [Paracoccus pantotrophus]|nr:hypothetical protein SAMN04244548_05360 [Paracoccus pantotrophus]
MLRNITLFLATSVAMFAGPGDADADDWQHAAAPMGQFEGGIDTATTGVGYSCAEFYTSVSVSLKGDHVGFATLRVDGRDIDKLRLAAGHDASESSAEIRYSNGKTPASEKARVNRLIRALAGGKQFQIVTQDGYKASLSLKGSRPIESCIQF